ncbi:MAG: hypothetical protein IID41_09260 [Planctomycetes bacterium]|nr:hypothetical protein [Planctomycetota bacterium]
MRPLLGGNGQPAPADPKVTTASNGHTPTANTPDAETKSAPTGQSATSNQKHFRPAGEPEVPSNALLSVSDLAKQFVVKATALGMQLNRFRLVQANHRHWREMEDTKPRDSKFLYRVSAVMPIIRKLQAKRQR